jgi:predicted MFS family arabinose efflux permease
MACAAPVAGRIVDRHGPRGVLIATGIVQPLALGLLLFAQALRLPLTALPPLAALSGAFAPPISTVTRTLWRHRFERDEDRRTAFAIDTVLIELNFTIGPMLIALVLLFGPPAAAFAMATVFALLSTPIFLLSPALRYWRLARDEKRHLLGPLTDVRLLRTYITAVALTFMFGMIEVGYPGYATARSQPALAGVLISLVSIGSASGGFAYGGLHLRASVERQLTGFLLVMVLPLALQALVTSVWAFALLAFVSGVLIAPSLTALTLLVTQYAPPRYATEAFTWMSTCVVMGIGAGMAVAGQLVERAGASAAFAVAAGACVLAALLSLSLRIKPQK